MRYSLLISLFSLFQAGAVVEAVEVVADGEEAAAAGEAAAVVEDGEVAAEAGEVAVVAGEAAAVAGEAAAVVEVVAAVADEAEEEVVVEEAEGVASRRGGEQRPNFTCISMFLNYFSPQCMKRYESWQNEILNKHFSSLNKYYCQLFEFRRL